MSLVNYSAMWCKQYQGEFIPHLSRLLPSIYLSFSILSYTILTLIELDYLWREMIVFDQNPFPFSPSLNRKPSLSLAHRSLSISKSLS